MLLALCLTPALNATATEGDQPGEVQTAFREQLVKIRNQLQNARARMSNGIVGMTRDTPATAASTTPATSCCSVNLEKIGAAVATLQKTLDAVDGCYGDRGETDARAAGKFVASDLALFSDAMRQWSETPDPRLAEAQLAVLVRPFNQMRDGLRALPECAGAVPKKKDRLKDGKS